MLKKGDADVVKLKVIKIGTLITFELLLFISELYKFKAAVLQNILKIISYIFFEIPPQIYIRVVRKKTYAFSLFCFENRQFAFLPSGYSYYT